MGWKWALGRAEDSGMGKDTYGKPGWQQRGELDPHKVETWGGRLQKAFLIEQERAFRSHRRQVWQAWPTALPNLKSNPLRNSDSDVSYSRPGAGQSPWVLQGKSCTSSVQTLSHLALHPDLVASAHTNWSLCSSQGEKAAAKRRWQNGGLK